MREQMNHENSKKPYRIVITGGAGFLGSHLCSKLIQIGHEVICIDNLITGNPDNLAPLMGNKRFRFLAYDVTNFVHIEGRVDVILHFASPASPTDYLEFPIQTLKVGALGTHKTLGLAKAKGARYLLASTSEVYGDPLLSPQTEDYWGNVNPVGPRGVYDEAKRFAEAMTMAYHRYHGVETRIVRIFNTYGPRMRLNDGRVLPTFMKQALHGEPLTIFGDGSQSRAFSYVGDIAPVIANAENIPAAENQIFNIGADLQFTVNELAKEVCLAMGKEGHTRHVEARNEVAHAYSSHEKAIRIFGNAKPTSLKEGLGRMALWALKTGSKKSDVFGNIEIREKLPPLWLE